ncbi:MAG: hypothetical protein WCA21_06595 [Terracidiphilus sp.]
MDPKNPTTAIISLLLVLAGRSYSAPSYAATAHWGTPSDSEDHSTAPRALCPFIEAKRRAFTDDRSGGYRAPARPR